MRISDWSSDVCSSDLFADLSGFAPRVPQQRMAAAVAQAYENNGSLIVEAGTGTGKTYAYLVPALLSGKRTLVSTGTRTLQDQLFHRDLPRVMSEERRVGTECVSTCRSRL